MHTISRAAARGQHNELLLISILLFYLFALFVNQFSYYMFCWREKEASEKLSGVYKYELVRYIYYKYSTLPRGITINITPKVGIFPGAEAEVNIHYQGCNIIDIPQGRVEFLFYYIGQVYTAVQTYLNTKAASFWTV